jgi:hypothetical protein
VEVLSFCPFSVIARSFGDGPISWLIEWLWGDCFIALGHFMMTDGALSRVSHIDFPAVRGKFKKLFDRDWGMVSVSQSASSFFTGGES